MGYARYLDILKEYNSDNELKKHLIVLETCDAQRVYMDAMARYNNYEREVNRSVSSGEKTEEEARERSSTAVQYDIILKVGTDIEAECKGMTDSHFSPLLGGRVVEDVYIEYDGHANTIELLYEWWETERIYTVEDFLNNYSEAKFIRNT